MEWLDALQVNLLKADKADYFKETWFLRNGREDFARLYAVVEGTGFVRHHGRVFRLQGGRLYLIPPDSGLDLGTPLRVRIWWVHATARLGGLLDLFRVLTPLYEIQDDAARTLTARVGRMVDGCLAGTRAGRLEAHGLFLQLLSPFFAEGAADAGKAPSPDWERFLPALLRMRETGERTPSVGELSALTGLTRGHFTARFHALTGMPPVRWLMASRIARAKLLLAQGAAPRLEAVARELGFHDAFHLSKQFKRHTGVSPKEFRRRAKRPALP